MKKLNFFTLEALKRVGAQYNIIFGQRSNGKTYAILCEGINNYAKNGKQTALLRRYLDDIRPSKIETIFNTIVKNGEVEKAFKNSPIKWSGIKYAKRKFWFTRKEVNSKGETEILIDDKPFMYVFALTESEDIKENNYPDITTIFFDEFISRVGYLANEFTFFMDIISTIKRDRKDVTIYMCGNTISRYCPYFKEMGLKHVDEIPLGKIEVYTYGETKLKVAVQRADNVTKINSKKDIDEYFAFDNPSLKMITRGEWELDIYPHLPFKYIPKEIRFVYFIKFDDKIYQCEIVHHERQWITYIHDKTTPIKDLSKDLIFTNEARPSKNIRTNIFKPYDEVGRKILYFFDQNKVFYQDNDVGDSIHNYLLTCKQS